MEQINSLHNYEESMSQLHKMNDPKITRRKSLWKERGTSGGYIIKMGPNYIKPPKGFDKSRRDSHANGELSSPSDTEVMKLITSYKEDRQNIKRSVLHKPRW